MATPSLQNDSQRFFRLAPELTYGNVPTFLLTISGTTPGGTFTMAWNGGAASSGIAYNCTAGALQTALQALLAADGSTALGTVATVTGTNPQTGLTITITGWKGAAGLTPSFTGITGTSLVTTLTGGPAWTVMKVAKFKHKPKLNVEVAKEIRNAMDMNYQDSVQAGGAIEDISFDFRLRPDQLPLIISAAGMDDASTVVGGETIVYDHAQKPASGANGGKSYALQMYDGQRCYVLMGCVGTDLNLKGAAGETGKYEGSFTGWSKKGQSVAVPAVVLPGNTSFRMLHPTNAGTNVNLNGTTNYAYLAEFDLKWKRTAKPYFTQTGTVDPYRPQYGERSVDLTIKILFDDPTEYDQAMTVAPPNRSVVFTLVGTDSIGSASFPQLVINVPRFIYKEPDIDMSGEATVATFIAFALYDTAAAAQLVLTSRNLAVPAY